MPDIHFYTVGASLSTIGLTLLLHDRYHASFLFRLQNHSCVVFLNLQLLFISVRSNSDNSWSIERFYGIRDTCENALLSLLTFALITSSTFLHRLVNNNFRFVGARVSCMLGLVVDGSSFYHLILLIIMSPFT